MAIEARAACRRPPPCPQAHRVGPPATGGGLRAKGLGDHGCGRAAIPGPQVHPPRAGAAASRPRLRPGPVHHPAGEHSGIADEARAGSPGWSGFRSRRDPGWGQGCRRAIRPGGQSPEKGRHRRRSKEDEEGCMSLRSQVRDIQATATFLERAGPARRAPGARSSLPGVSGQVLTHSASTPRRGNVAPPARRAGGIERRRGSAPAVTPARWGFPSGPAARRGRSECQTRRRCASLP